MRACARACVMCVCGCVVRMWCACVVCVCGVRVREVCVCGVHVW